METQNVLRFAGGIRQEVDGTVRKFLLFHILRTGEEVSFFEAKKRGLVTQVTPNSLRGEEELSAKRTTDVLKKANWFGELAHAAGSFYVTSIPFAKIYLSVERGPGWTGVERFGTPLSRKLWAVFFLRLGVTANLQAIAVRNLQDDPARLMGPGEPCFVCCGRFLASQEVLALCGEKSISYQMLKAFGVPPAAKLRQIVCVDRIDPESAARETLRGGASGRRKLRI